MIFNLSVKIFGIETTGVHKVEEEGSLVLFLHPDDLLSDVLSGGANSSHCQEHVVTQEVSEEKYLIRKYFMLGKYLLFSSKYI